MEKYMIVGGNRLQGKIKVSGSKNASLPILAASLLCPGESIIEGVPKLKDICVMCEVLNSLGAKVIQEGNTIRVDASNINCFTVNEELTRKMRASNLVLGAMLGRFRNITISHPGG